MRITLGGFVQETGREIEIEVNDPTPEVVGLCGQTLLVTRFVWDEDGLPPLPRPDADPVPGCRAPRPRPGGLHGRSN